jgi:hypothetical protein
MEGFAKFSIYVRVEVKLKVFRICITIQELTQKFSKVMEEI